MSNECRFLWFTRGNMLCPFLPSVGQNPSDSSSTCFHVDTSWTCMGRLRHSCVVFTGHLHGWCQRTHLSVKTWLAMLACHIRQDPTWTVEISSLPFSFGSVQKHDLFEPYHFRERPVRLDVVSPLSLSYLVDAWFRGIVCACPGRIVNNWVVGN